MGCVYLVYRKDGGGSYIGKTVKTLEHRKSQHINAAMRGEDWAFYRAYRQHGAEAWGWRELVFSDCAEELARQERETIATCRAFGVRLYNSTDGGEGTAGRVATAETRAKISAKRRGTRLSDEHRAKISAAQTHAPMSEETKRRMAEARRAYWAARRAAGLSMVHSSVSEAGRARLSEIARARWADRKAGGASTIGSPKQPPR